MDTLDGVRQLWREFGLNNSKGSGMRITDEGEIKQHGTVHRDSDFRYCFTDFVVRKPADAGGSDVVKSGKRSRGSK